MIRVLPFLFIVLLFYSLSGRAATVSSVEITQVDTFALKAMEAQPVLKIKVVVTGTGTVNFNNMVIHTSNDNNSDVDSVAVYYTGNYNRFSKVDYPGDYSLYASKKKIAGDSAYFEASLVLDPGTHYFWVTMDLSSVSRASRSLDAYVNANQISIGANTYPSSATAPSGTVEIYDIYFQNGFESINNSGYPSDWSQVSLNTTSRWKCNYGGAKAGSTSTAHPSGPMSGNYNAMLEKQSYTTSAKIILASEPIDLSLSTKPLITFYHAQSARCQDANCTETVNDELKVLYKTSSTGAWDTLKSYTLATSNYDWTKREVYFPDNLSSSSVYLGFLGITHYGWGVCVDSVTIYETEKVNRSIYSVTASNKVLDVIPQGAATNPVLRVNIRVKGNNGSIKLNNITFTSNNTKDSDIKSSGVKFYYTDDSLFTSPVQIGSAASISGGKTTFTGLSKALETGNNYFWVTYDVTSSAYPGDLVDAYIKQGDIGLSISGTYPSVDLNPDSSRVIKQSLLYDDFDDTKQWTLSGEFEIDSPHGYGGTNYGQPDPASAYSGSRVLGTDLTGLGSNKGDYEPNITSAGAYTAVSPLIDGRYFKNMELQFYRYLNVDNTDSAMIDYQISGTSTWTNIWTNSKRYAEYDWGKEIYNSLSELRRKKFYIRFKLGPSDEIANYSGWNIDNFYVLADSVPYDAAIHTYVGPVSNCGLSSAEHVQVYVKNEGPNPLKNTPIKLSLDGGSTYSISETIASTIAVDDSILYTFSTGINLSKAGIYHLVVKVAHPKDNYDENDSISEDVIAFPTYSLPYATSFEEDTTYWFSGGTNSSWNEDYPLGTHINKSATGYSCWMTNNYGYHNLYENSYVESPCIAFTGTEIPMIDVKYNTYTNPNASPNSDGAILQYSLDKGVTWNYAKEDTFSYSWYWYNDTVTSLKHKGWGGSTSDSWVQGRQALPSGISNQNLVRFRFVFKADSATATRYDGVAFDDFKVYEAPFDLGITKISGLSDPACQYANSPYLNVTIKNFGNKTVESGDTIFLGASVNSVAGALDTLVVTSSLSKGNTLNYTFKHAVDFTATGSYKIRAFTMNESDPGFFGTNNDTATVSLTVYQNPITTLPDTIYSARIDTITLRTKYDSNYKYYWNNSSTAGTYSYAVSDTGTYRVRVQNNISGCETSDSVYIKTLTPDIAISTILSPTNSCGYKTSVHPVILIKNDGSDTIKTNRVIPVYVKLDNNTAVSENVTLSKILAPDSTITDTLTLTVDVSAAKSYSLKIYSAMPYDTIRSNDTAKVSFTIYGYPTVDLGNTYVNATNTSYKISVASGYNSYSWSNTTDSTTTNTVNTTGWYSVTVTDTHSCPAIDSVFVFFKLRDVMPYKLVSPVSSCTKSSTSDLTLRIFNNGTDTISASDTLFFKYNFNSTGDVTDTLKVTSNIIPGDSLDYTFKDKKDLTTIGKYNFKFTVNNRSDYKPQNDTASYIVYTYGNPTPSLGSNASVVALEYNLVPTGSGYVSFKWQDGSTDTSYLITKTHKSTTDQYQVTVIDTNGCSGTSAKVTKVLVVNDVELTSINLASSACSLTSTESVKVSVTNTGNTPIQSSKIIKLKYQVDGGSFSKIDTLTLSGTFTEALVLTHTFSQKADLSGIGNHRVKAYVEYDQDVNTENDTLTHWIKVNSSPTVDFGTTNDTLITNFPYTLDAGTGYTSYLWSTGSSTESISVKTSGKYWVSVADTNGCFGVDSVVVLEEIKDLSVTGISIPTSNCKLSNAEAITISVTNSGNTTFTDEAFALQYILDGTGSHTENFTFTGTPKTVNKFTFTNTEDLSAIMLHSMGITLTYTSDEVSTNNSGVYSIVVAGYPSVDLGGTNDTIYTKTYPYTLTPGSSYSSYLWQDGSTGSSYSATQEGWYNVTVANSSGCSGKDSVFVKSASAVGKVSDEATMKVYPNPASDIMWLELNLKLGNSVTVEIFNQEGKLVDTKSLSGYNYYLEKYDVSNLAAGIYYIRVYNDKWLISDKILIK